MSPFSFKKSRKTTKISLNSLPNELLTKIFSDISASSLSENYNLQLVSKEFKHLCNDQYVISRLSFHEVSLFPWRPYNHKKHSTFFQNCLKNGNPEALYRKGIIDYFNLAHEQRGDGIKYLIKAVEKGNKEAQFIYGMILLCLGSKTKQQGYKVLSSLLKPFMSSTIVQMINLRKRILDKILWRGGPVLRQLRRSYVREICNCDGQTKKFLARSCVWNGYGENNDMATSSACEICLWDRELELLFNSIPY